MPRARYRVINIGNGEYRYEHVLVAEAALGKPIPSGSIVHHVDGDNWSNTSTNLVVCQDQRYHKLLHMRERAVAAGYPPNYRPCAYCKEFDDPSNMSENAAAGQVYHKPCANIYCHELRNRL